MPSSSSRHLPSVLRVEIEWETLTFRGFFDVKNPFNDYLFGTGILTALITAFLSIVTSFAASAEEDCLNIFAHMRDVLLSVLELIETERLPETNTFIQHSFGGSKFAARDDKHVSTEYEQHGAKAYIQGPVFTTGSAHLRLRPWPKPTPHQRW